MKSVNSQVAQYARPSCYKTFTLLNCSVLAFAVTVIIPLSMGITKLPFTISLPVFVAGFISLFWLARQKDDKNSDSRHAKINNFEDSKNRYGKSNNLKEEEREKFDIENEVPLELVRDHMEETLTRYEFYMDNATKEKLADLCRQLEKIN